MLNAIVPPPIELASRIAWRNEPVPLSLVFVTVKTKGVVGLCTSVGSWAIVASDSLAFRTRVGRVERVVLNTLAKVEASKIDEIDNSSKRKSASRGVLFHFVLWGLICFFTEVWGVERPLLKNLQQRQVF
jgi:hypothetical protein